MISSEDMNPKAPSYATVSQDARLLDGLTDTILDRNSNKAIVIAIDDWRQIQVSVAQTVSTPI